VAPRCRGPAGVASCSVALHLSGRPKLAAAIRGMLTALSAAMLAGAAYTTAPTGSQITLLLVGSVLAGCLAVSWVAAGRKAQKKSPKSIRNMDGFMLCLDMLAGYLAVSPSKKIS
jgi:hypothetical protein